MRMGGTLGCLPVPGLRWRFTLACGLPPIQGLFVCFDPVTGGALSLHPGLGSASPSGLLLAIMSGEQTADALHYELCYVIYEGKTGCLLLQPADSQQV